MLLATAFVPGLAFAQLPLNGETPRGRLRDRYTRPQNAGRFDDSVRKLKGDDPEARLEAVRAFGELNDPKSIDYLIAAASDDDMRIRIKAIDTLGNIHAKDATPLLIQQLFMRDTTPPTQQRILVALGKIGDPRATSPVVDFLSRDVDVALRGNAIFALGDIGDDAAIPPLEALARDSREESLRRLAAEAVRKIRSRPAEPVVLPALAVERRGPGGQQP